MGMARIVDSLSLRQSDGDRSSMNRSSRRQASRKIVKESRRERANASARRGTDRLADTKTFLSSAIPPVAFDER
jgi:hypothetical protein